MNPPRSASAHRNFRARAQDRIVPTSLKTPARLVGVIANRAALEKAGRLRQPPDFLELRLDLLRDCLEEIEATIPKLRAPLIFTARHPAEGGGHALSAKTRRDLLRRFLEHAAFIDVERRSAPHFAALLAEARQRKIGLIISSHDLRATPSPEALRRQLTAAMRYRPDIFKIATRTDTSQQLDRLIAFFEENSGAFPIAAMGMGKRGAASRRRLLRLGSVLNYAALDRAFLPGQPTLRRLRRIRAAYII